MSKNLERMPEAAELEKLKKRPFGSVALPAFKK
jgi:hypothetical protein